MYKVIITVIVDKDDPQEARWAAKDSVLDGDVDVDQFEVEEIE